MFCRKVLLAIILHTHLGLAVLKCDNSLNYDNIRLKVISIQSDCEVTLINKVRLLPASCILDLSSSITCSVLILSGASLSTRPLSGLDIEAIDLKLLLTNK